MEANRAYYSYTKACAEQAVLAANSDAHSHLRIAAAFDLGAAATRTYSAA